MNTFVPGRLPEGSAQLGRTDARPTWGELQTARRAKEREARVRLERERLLLRRARPWAPAVAALAGLVTLVVGWVK